MQVIATHPKDSKVDKKVGRDVDDLRQPLAAVWGRHVHGDDVIVYVGSEVYHSAPLCGGIQSTYAYVSLIPSLQKRFKWQLLCASMCMQKTI